MKYIIIAIFTIFSIISSASELNTYNSVEIIEIHPKGFQEPIKYKITLPHKYDVDTDKAYFVLFDLHPRSQPLIAGMQDWLSHNGEWPWLKTIIVTPASYHAEFSEVFKNWAKTPEKQEILDILQLGILKAVDAKYRTNGFKIYSGFMGNGALGLYTLLNRPEMFNAYMIASPTLANNMGNIVSDAPEKLNTLNRKMSFLYMTIGDHRFERNHIPSVMEFEQHLGNIKHDKLKWITNTNEQHYYMSRPVITLLNGIEALFDDIHNDLAADSDISKLGAQAIIKYYKMLSDEKYGFEISAEGSLKALAKSLASDQPEKALDIYTKTTELYPESAYAYSSLAKAYADQGDIKKAIKIQQIAVEKSKSMVKWHQNKHQQYLDEFKALLNN